MKERVIETCVVTGLCNVGSIDWDDKTHPHYTMTNKHFGRRCRFTCEIIETIPTPAEDWLEFSSRFNGDGKPPARMLKLVKTWEKPRRSYLGRWMRLSQWMLPSDGDKAERACLRVMLGRLFARCEYDDWMVEAVQ